jgi:hydrogenase maturation protease
VADLIEDLKNQRPALMTIGDANILILGIGNPLWADDGFGVRAVQALQHLWRFPRRVTLVDGGTQGLGLLPLVQAAHKVIVFDAINNGLPGGSLTVLCNEQVPRVLGINKLSLHLTGFPEVLAYAALTGYVPSELVLIGVQPVVLDDFGASLHAAVKAQIQPALKISLAYLRLWGIEPESQSAGPEAAGSLLSASLDIAAYEVGRSCDADRRLLG